MLNVKSNAFEYVNAKTDYHVSEKETTRGYIVMPNDREPPSDSWNLVDSGVYDFNGLAQVSDLYTNYFLTGKSSMALTVINDSKENSLKFAVFKKGGKKIKTYTVSANSEYHCTVNGLDPSVKYYIRFYAPCDFHGSAR
jgi:hypothetical protein